MSETNLLHYIQSGEFVDKLIEAGIYDAIYADVDHLFPNCLSLTEFKPTNTDKVLIILSRLTVAQLLEQYPVTDVDQVTIVNLRVGVGGIGHKFTSEMDDIALMTGYGWRVYEPASLADLDQISSHTDQAQYIRITHRYLPSELPMSNRDGLWYSGELTQYTTLFPASMIETVGLLNAEEQTSHYVLVSDWTNWYLGDSFREQAQVGGSTIVIMEQSQQSAADYVDMIQSLYPKHRIKAITVPSQIRDTDVIVDEYRDEWYGCDVQAVSQLLRYT